MDYDEALAWLRGERSMTNNIPSGDIETWALRIAQADAACMLQAYFIIKAHKEGFFS